MTGEGHAGPGLGSQVALSKHPQRVRLPPGPLKTLPVSLLAPPLLGAAQPRISQRSLSAVSACGTPGARDHEGGGREQRSPAGQAAGPPLLRAGRLAGPVGLQVAAEQDPGQHRVVGDGGAVGLTFAKSVATWFERLAN
jgi:hypothetical protein